ncbi:MAG TPA: slipin family protein [Bryobacteraceae bacterium]|nr:slipin family protein [Bryobacteraceae bacterium]
MFLWKRVVAGELERALVFVRGRLEEVLEPGVHYVRHMRPGLEVEVVSTLHTVLTSAHAATLVRSENRLVDAYFHRVLAPEGHAAVILADGMLVRVLAPGETALVWKTPRAVEIRRFDMAAEPKVEAALLPALIRFGAAAARVQFVTVGEETAGLVYVNGRLLQRVGPGTHAFWAMLGAVRVELVELRRQLLEVNGQEILTKDKVTLRVNISAEFRVADPELAARTVRNPGDLLYRLLQLAVRRTLGTRTLDELLQEKVDIDPASAEAIRKEMLAVGVVTGAMALKDVILPGEIREILNQVVAAEKRAQANLIQRREETAATRSLLNTARLMEESPILLRLKELETLEKLTEKVGSVTVTGGFEGMLEKLLPGPNRK